MTRFSADWHARRELSVLESERKLVDKACGVIDLGMGTMRDPFPDTIADPVGPSFLTTITKSRGAESAKRKPAEAATSQLSDRSAAVAPSERVVLAAVIRALALHPKVEWATRMNVGGMTLDGRHVRFGFKGCSDIIGQTTDGRFLAVECKRPGAKATNDQIAFLCRVQRAGGVAFVAWSVDDVARGLA